MNRRAEERSLFEKMIAATYLPPAERDKRGHKLYVKYSEMDAETTRRFHAADKLFK